MTAALTQYLEAQIGKFKEEQTAFIPLTLQHTITHTYFDTQRDQTCGIEDIDYPQYVLIGDPGAGKSTTLRDHFIRQAKTWLREGNKAPIPFWINLGYSENPIDAEKLIDYWWAMMGLAADAWWVHLRNHQLILYLDGLNEMPENDRGSRHQRAESLKAFLYRQGQDWGLRALITCRIRDYEDDEKLRLGDQLPVVSVLPLDVTQRDQIIQGMLGTLPSELLTTIERHEPLQKISLNPLNLSMLVTVYQENPQAIESIDLRNLYGRYLRSRHRDFARQNKLSLRLSPRLSPEQIEKRIDRHWQQTERGLRYLAFRMLSEGQGTTADRDWIYGFIPLKAKQEIMRLLSPIFWYKEKISPSDILGIVSEIFLFLLRPLRYRYALKDGFNLGAVIQDQNTIHFYHQSIQGYLASPLLSEALSDERTLNDRVQLIRQLGDLEEAGSEAIPALMSLLNHQDKEIYLAVMNALRQIGQPSIPILIQTLNNTDRTMCGRAAVILGRIGDETSVQSLITLIEHRDGGVVACAIDALGNLAHKSAVSPLATKLLDHRSYLRSRAAITLGKIGDVRAVQPLIVALNDSSYHVRRHAAISLGTLGDIAAVQSLLTSLSDPNEDVQACVVAALGKLGHPSAIQPLIGLFNNGHQAVIRNTVTALGQIGETAIAPLIKALSAPEASLRYCYKIRQALAAIGEPALHPLIACLDDTSINARYIAAQLLTKIGTIDALNAVKNYNERYPNDFDEILMKDMAESLAQTILSIRVR